MKIRSGRARSSIKRFGVSLIAGALLVMFLPVSAALADSPDPVDATMTGSFVTNPDGTHTLTISGTWEWKRDCGERQVGWEADWNDPTQPGNIVGTANGITVDVGAASANSRNPADNTVNLHPSGPGNCTPGSPQNTGVWGPISHTYPADITEVTACVVLYDVQIPPKSSGGHSLIAGGSKHNDDNSVEKNQNVSHEGCFTKTFKIKKPDLQITKSDSPDPAAKNGDVTYSIQVKNLGGGSATGVVMEDVMPAGATWQSHTSSKGTCAFAGGKVTCNIGNMTSDEMVTVTIIVKMEACGSIVNTATVKANETETVTSNNTATATTTVNCPTENPDLSIVKTASPGSIVKEGQTAFSITATNNGPGTATGVTITDTLESDVWWVSHTGPCTKSGPTITCDIGTLAPGQSATVTITVTIKACGTATNTARVEGDQTDPNPGNNSSTASVDAICGGDGPDLEVVKVGPATPMEAGSHVIYTVTVTNLGPDDAHDVELTDTVDHVSWRLWSPPVPSQGSCTPVDADTGDVITCMLGTIRANDSVTITFDIKARLCEPMTNTATVSGAEADPNPANNSATVHTTIEGKCDVDPDMSIHTTAPWDSRVGETYIYRLRIHQGGPEHGTGITVTNKLDEELVFLSAASSQGECSESNGKVVCDLGEMAVFTNAWVKIKVLAIKTGMADNHAEVEVNEYDADLSNNVSTVGTDIGAYKDKGKKHRYI